MKELELLQDKLRLFVKHYNELNAEYSRLQKQHDKQTALIETQKSDLAQLQEQLKNRSVANSVEVSGSDTELLKKQLDKVIQAIEKNIESL